MSGSGSRDYVIRYIDNDQELINVSDDEDLLEAYEVAENSLNSNLKLTVTFKQSLQKSFAFARESSVASTTTIPRLNLPEHPAINNGSQTERVVSQATPFAFEEVKRDSTAGEEPLTANETASILSRTALKKAMKQAQKELLKKEKIEKQAIKALKKKTSKLHNALKTQKEAALDFGNIMIANPIKEKIETISQKVFAAINAGKMFIQDTTTSNP